MPRNLSAHIASILAAIFAALAAFHIGWHPSPSLTKEIVAVAGGVVTVLQALHIGLKWKWLDGFNKFQLEDAARKFEATKQTPASQ